MFIVFKEFKKNLNFDEASMLYDEIYNQIKVVEVMNSLKYANLSFETEKNTSFLINIKNLILFSTKHDFIKYIINDILWPKKYLQSSLLISKEELPHSEIYRIQVILEFTLNLEFK